MVTLRQRFSPGRMSACTSSVPNSHLLIMGFQPQEHRDHPWVFFHQVHIRAVPALHPPVSGVRRIASMIRLLKQLVHTIILFPQCTFSSSPQTRHSRAPYSSPCGSKHVDDQRCKTPPPQTLLLVSGGAHEHVPGCIRCGSSTAELTMHEEVMRDDVCSCSHSKNRLGAMA